MSVKLFKGDCLELMEQIEDESIDMILCDLPFGMTANKWDTVIPLAHYLNTINGLLNRTALFFCLVWASLALS